MKLGIIKIDGVPFVVDNAIISNPLINGEPLLQAKDTLDSNYEDISSITNWDKYGMVAGKDFKVVKYQIELLGVSIGYANLPLSEQILANKYFASGVEYNNAQVTVAEQKAFFNDFMKPNSDIARKQRDLAVTEWVVRKLYTGVLAQAVTDQLIREAEVLRTEYLRDGTSGIGYSDTIDGVVNFVKNDSGFTPSPIVAVNTGTKTFSVAGDKTTSAPADKVIRIRTSTGNDGAYTVVSSSFDNTNTNIVVVEAIPSAVADGTIYVKGLLYYAGITTAMQTELYDIYWNGIY